MSIVIFLAILLVLVLAHEFGHFIIAKKSGIRVDTFAFGFPPKLFSRKIGETEYVVNALPIGGYVKIFGEDGSTDGDDEGRSFSAKPRYIQAAVILGGITMNIIVAWILLSITLMIGMKTSVGANSFGTLRETSVTITQVLHESPAEIAGLKAGDTILGISDEKGERTQMVNVAEISHFIGIRNGESLSVQVLRSGKAESVTVRPTFSDDADRALIGIAMDETGLLRLPPHTAFLEGALKTRDYFLATAYGIYDFIKTAVTGKASMDAVSGPIGIVGAVGDAAALGISHVLFFAALISINLAVINVLPFPALDGGRFLFILIESVTRKKLPASVTQWANTLGFIFLMLLMVVVTYGDIVKLIK